MHQVTHIHIHTLLMIAIDCSYAYMIDNICLLIRGTLNNKDAQSLITEVCSHAYLLHLSSLSLALSHMPPCLQCHPLGMFESMATLTVANNVSELYHSVIVDTPLGMAHTYRHQTTSIQQHYSLLVSTLFPELLV
jgi:vacuolar-type H+-ATPase subunit C/Vma6